LTFRSTGDATRLATSRRCPRTSSERQIAQQCNAYARYRTVTRSQRPIRLRLLQQYSRI
jgi:hypothetical protein